MRNTVLTPKQQQGFSLAELVIVIIIVAVLFGFAIDRLLKLEARAERAAIEQIIGTLQSALAMEISAHVARNNIPGLARFVGTNPMNNLSDTPVNYLGEVSHADIQDMESGQWVYDRGQQVLFYKVINTEYLQTETEATRAYIGFKIDPVFDDTNGNARYDTNEVLRGLKLQALHVFRWSDVPLDITDYTK